MKILAICNKGNTRSRYLAKYLHGKGYSTKWGGVSRTAKVNLTQNKLDWADKILITDNAVLKKLKERYKIPKKEIIKLNVSDSPRDYPKKAGKEIEEARKRFLENYVYPNLRKQINKKLII